MGDDYKQPKTYLNRKDDPALNDDSQPSVTNETQVLEQAAANSGLPAQGKVAIPAPADAVDLAYRTALADVDATEVGKAVAEQQKSGKDAEDIDVQKRAGGSPGTTKSQKTTAKK